MTLQDLRWPKDSLLHSLLESSDLIDRAVARNFLYDHLISPERAMIFDRFLHPLSSPDQFKRAVIDYFKARVLTRKRPDFLLEVINAHNILTRPIPSIKADLHLVRLLDFNSLTHIYSWAKAKRIRPFVTFPSGHNPDVVAQWLDMQLLGHTDSHNYSFIEATLDVLNSYRRDAPSNPTWVTTWSAFSDFVSQGPERWLEVLGVSRPSPARWIVLLRYTVREAGTVVRPTQLDAGWYPYYFPAPPAAPKAVGSHAMDLRVSPRPDRLLPEYIHKQIDHSPSHFVTISRTSRPIIGDLEQQRKCHLEMLTSIYGANVLEWMPSPI